VLYSCSNLISRSIDRRVLLRDMLVGDGGQVIQ